MKRATAVTPAKAGVHLSVRANGSVDPGLRRDDILGVVTCALLCLLSFSVSAQEMPQWQAVAEESSLTFEATQNDATVTGEFAAFDADIRFDPQRLEASKVTVSVAMGSVDAVYEAIPETLKTPVWFHAEAFPNAVFATQSIRHAEENRYVADATLTIRGQALPLTLAFTLEEYTDARAVVSGEATLSRTAYGIGQGEWAGTEVIKDAVKVQMKVVALPR